MGEAGGSIYRNRNAVRINPATSATHVNSRNSSMRTAARHAFAEEQKPSSMSPFSISRVA